MVLFWSYPREDRLSSKHTMFLRAAFSFLVLLSSDKVYLLNLFGIGSSLACISTTKKGISEDFLHLWQEKYFDHIKSSPPYLLEAQEVSELQFYRVKTSEVPVFSTEITLLYPKLHFKHLNSLILSTVFCSYKEQF